MISLDTPSNHSGGERVKRKRLLVLSLVLALVAFSLLFAATASAKMWPRGHPIRWDPPVIREEVSPGEVFTATATFSSTRDLGPVRLRVTPSLRGVLTFTPTQVFTVTANTPYTVNLILTVPSASALCDRDSLNGLLQVRRACQNWLKPEPNDRDCQNWCHREREEWRHRMNCRTFPHPLRLRFPIVRETE